MAAAAYSYIDVAVLDAVRERFAAGDAIVILSADLAEVAWINGPGAALFGKADVEAMIGAPSGLGLAARRQIMATRGYPAIGRDRPVLVRLAAGALAFSASTITLPDGEAAIMLARQAAPSADIVSAAIGGFANPGHFLAFVDDKGEVEAASPEFEGLAIAPRVLADLVAEVADEADRLVKRIIPSGAGKIPAGIARLRDRPARHLLVVVAEALQADAALMVSDAAPDDSFPAQVVASAGPLEITEASPAEPARLADAGLLINAEHSGQADDDLVVEVVAPRHETAEPEYTIAPPAGGAESEDPRQVDDGLPAAATPTTESAHVDATASVAVRNAPSIRFAWKTDADGRISAMSSEFLAAVGTDAADILGHSFAEVSQALDLDPEREVAGLLERRDTWSGRSVLWPVVGTALRVPVDLAALPVYSRDRAFEGFRGFGIARLADAVPAGGRAEPASDDEAETASPREEKSPKNGAAAEKNPEDIPASPAAPTPHRGGSDKIIRLAEHRPPVAEKGLTTVERSAFREIGEKLRKAGGLDDRANAAKPKIAEPAENERLEKDTIKSTRDAGAFDDMAAGTEPTVKIAAEASEETSATIVPLNEPEEGAVAASLAVADENTTVVDLERLLQADLAAQSGASASAVTGPDEPWTVQADEPVAFADLTVAGSDNDNAAAFTEPYAHQSDEFRATEEAEKLRVEPGLDLEPPAPAEPGIADEVQPDEVTVSMAADQPADTVVPVEHPVGTDTRIDDTTVAAAPLAEPEQIDVVAAADTTDAIIVGQSPADADIPPVAPAAAPPAFEASAPPALVQDTPILARLPVPILIHSGDVLHYANDEFLSLTGYPTLPALVAAGGLGALFVDPYQGEARDDDRSLRLKTADGEVFPIEALLRSVPWSGGRALMLVVRRTGDLDEDPQEPPFTQAEAETLRARIAEMRAIIDTATDGVVLIATDGTIRSISRPAEALFGLESDDVSGKPFAHLFAMESQRAARDYVAGLSDHGVASVLNDGREVIGREAQGRFIPLFMTIGRLPGSGGYCAVMRDITPWKRAEEELTQARAAAERASQQKSEFLARISHEIRTPLNAIIGFSELMIDERFGPLGNDRYREYLRDVNRSGNHVLELVNDLLDISKIEAGEQEMTYEAVGLNEMLTQTVAMMQPQANRERVIIRSSLASRLPDVVADSRSVRQIALNLLSNAVRFTQAGGQVIVSTAYEPSGDVVLRVRDTGIGMSPTEIEQALKPFRQINTLKRDRGDGTGLGLPLTKAMVEANRARFTINSTPGEGTLVEVAFPPTRVLAN